MLRRLLALVLGISLLGLPTAGVAAATGPDPGRDLDAVVLVREADLPALLAMEPDGAYTLIDAAELGLDDGALVGLGLFGEDTLLTPAALGLDTPGMGLFPFFFTPFFAGFTTISARVFVPVTTFAPINVTVPVLTFRPLLFTPVFTLPFPFFGNIGLVIIRR
jgi:hypothetical protein